MYTFSNVHILRKCSFLQSLLLLSFSICTVFASGLTLASSCDEEETIYSSSEEDGTASVQENMSMSQSVATGDLIHVDFEIHGQVQGVFFRKYTQREGTKLGLRGFCRNTSAGTVSGSMEGPRQAIDQMKRWLQQTGSPSSRISEAVFKNEKKIDAYTFPSVFDIARTV